MSYTFGGESHSSASPEAVWEILVDSLGWPRWAGVPKPIMDVEGDPAPFGLGAVRRFKVGPVNVREEVVTWEPPQRYEYTIAGGVPVRGYRSTVTLTRSTDGGTDIDWHGVIERAVVPGTGRLARAFLGTALRRFTRGLAKFADSHPSP